MNITGLFRLFIPPLTDASDFEAALSVGSALCAFFGGEAFRFKVFQAGLGLAGTASLSGNFGVLSACVGLCGHTSNFRDTA